MIRFLIKSLKNNVLPEYNMSPYLNWIFNSGYFYDLNDKIEFFTSKFSNEKTEKEKLSS